MDPKKREGIRDSQKKNAPGTKKPRIPDSKNRPIPASRRREYGKNRRGPQGRNLTVEQSGENRKYRRLEKNPRNLRSEEDSTEIRDSTNRPLLNSANRGKPRIQEIQVPMEASPNPNITNTRKNRPNSKQPRPRDSAGARNHIYESNNQRIRGNDENEQFPQHRGPRKKK